MNFRAYEMTRSAYTFMTLEYGLELKCGKRPSLNYLSELSKTAGVLIAQSLPDYLMDRQLQSLIHSTSCEISSQDGMIKNSSKSLDLAC